MPLLAVGALGLVMVAFVAAAPWIVGTYGYAVLIPGIVASGAITVAATALAPSMPARAGLIVILGLALVMRVLLVGEEPFLSTDIYRYVWDGRVQAAAINPYAYVPADDALKALRDSAIYPNINRADYAVTAYPPVAQMFFLAVTRIAETLTAMRLAMVACEIVIVAVIIDLLRRLRLPATAVVAWAWHPLAIWEISNNGHVDALMVALMMTGIWLLVRSPALAGAIAVALAALVKPYAIVVLPAFWRRWDWRVPLVVLATVALCYLPYLGAGRGVLGFATTGYLSEEGFSDGDGFWLVALVRAAIGQVPGLTGAYVLVALGVMAWFAVRRVDTHGYAATDDARRHRRTADGRVVLPVAELCLVFPRGGSVHRARRRRAGLGHDPGSHAAVSAGDAAGQRAHLENIGHTSLRHRGRVGPDAARAHGHAKPWSIPMDDLTPEPVDREPVDARRYFEAGTSTHGGIADKPPVCLYLEVTNRCNLLCTTCPRTYVELEPPADMSWELFVRIVDQLPGLTRAVLHGVGEPMLVKNLPQMVRYLKDRGVYVLFNTNGTVLSEKNGRALIAAGLDELRVSLDASTPESYIKIRGKDYFRRIVKNVKAFRALQEREGHATPRVSAWLTGLKETIEELPGFVRLAAEIGVKEVHLQRLVFFDRETVGLARPDQALFEQMNSR